MQPDPRPRRALPADAPHPPLRGAVYSSSSRARSPARCTSTRARRRSPSASATCSEPTDWITSTHRPHGHALAKGVTPRAAMAELYGKSTGCCARQGRLDAPRRSRRSACCPRSRSSAAATPSSPGLGLAFKLRRSDQVAVCFFGDGASNEGAFHEGLNFAAVRRLPIVFVCENNLYGASTPFHARLGPGRRRRPRRRLRHPRPRRRRHGRARRARGGAPRRSRPRAPATARRCSSARPTASSATAAATRAATGRATRRRPGRSATRSRGCARELARGRGRGGIERRGRGDDRRRGRVRAQPRPTPTRRSAPRMSTPETVDAAG